MINNNLNNGRGYTLKLVLGTFGVAITIMLFMVGYFVNESKATNENVEDVEDRVSFVEGDIKGINVSIGSINQAILRIEAQLKR